MISFGCPSCQMKLTVKPEFAGRSSRCPTCKQPLTVPSPVNTEAYVPPQSLDGEESGLAKIGHDGGVTLERDPAGCNPTRDPKSQRSVGEALARRQTKKERYVIEGEIARGGMGAVLRAVDGDLRREVAVKYLLDQKDPAKKVRFVEEAQINAQLEHPNIVPVYDLRIDAQGRPYLMMKLVKGRDLKSILDQLREDPKQAEKEWSLGRLLNILVNICNGLAFAHARDVVHRDLKPANIMLGDFGEVYVMDWGLAKVLKGGLPMAIPVTEADLFSDFMGETSDTVPPPSPQGKVVTNRELDTDLTQEGSVMGTAVYMAPEQAAGNVQAIDQRSDVYALGVILYEMLTLQSPIDKEGGVLAILVRVAEGDMIPAEQRDPQRTKAGKVPKELAAIAMKAMATKPDQRYPDVGELRKDIERYQEGRSVSAKEDTPKELLWKFVKRNKGLSAGMAAAFLVLVCSLGIIGKAWLRANEAVQQMKEVEAARKKQGRDSVPSLVRAARLLTTEKQFADAMTQLDTALQFDDQDADAHLLFGQLLIGEQRYEEAREHFVDCLSVRPKDVQAKKLAQLCSGARPDLRNKLLPLAAELDSQGLFAISTRVSKQAEALQGPRSELQALYRKRIDAAWPGAGGGLTVDDAGVRLYLGGNDKIKDLTPLTGMNLTALDLSLCEWITDLKPLKELPLKELTLRKCIRVQDFTPLSTMPLSKLDLTACPHVRDLTLLKGMALNTLILTDCSQVADVTPLQGMPLTTLSIGGQFGSTQVSDLTPLKGMPLTALNICGSKVRDLTPLKGMPLVQLDASVLPQLDDLTPLKGMPLASLNLNRAHAVHDLMPLKGMPLTFLDIGRCEKVRSLEPLRGTPLKDLWTYENGVTDLRPLQGMTLDYISFTPGNTKQGLEVIREMKSLKAIGTSFQRGIPPATFWDAFDKGSFK